MVAINAHIAVGAGSVVAYAMTFVVVAGLTWKRPIYGVTALIVLDPFAFYRYVGPTAITLPKVAIIAVAVTLIARRTPVGVLRRPEVAWTGLAALALVVTTAISIAQADYLGAAVRETLKAAEYLLFFVVAAVAFYADADERAIRNACFAIATIVAILALLQEHGGAGSALWVSGHAVGRVAGPLEGPNQLSGYLGLLIPVTTAFIVRERLPGWTWAFVALAFVTDVLTFSRAGVAATLLAIAVTLLAARVRSLGSWSVAIGACIVAGLGAAVAAGGRISRFFSSTSQLQPEGLGTRSQLWTAAWRLWRHHPLLGIGADNYEWELSRAGYPELHTHANSQFIQALVDGGIPLFAAFVWATVQPIVTLLRSGVLAPLVAGTAGALAGLAFHQVLDDMTFFPKVGTMAWILTGAALACAARLRENGAQPPGSEARRA